MQTKNTHHGFSIIEVMISIFVFALGLTSVFMMLSGSITMSNYSRNLIIASHLANEEVELFKNIRDSNYSSGKKWSYTKTDEDYDANGIHFEVDHNYKLSNNYDPNATSPIEVEALPDSLIEDDVNSMGDYRLCLTDEGIYTYDCTSPNIETNFYRYLRVEVAEYDDGGTSVEIGNELADPNLEVKAFKITSKVIWVGKTYRNTEISTVVTDWKRY